MLMLGVICLANAHEALQIMWAGSFILLNAAYWIVAALPDNTQWDLSIYTVKEHATNIIPVCDTFTQALWKAIALCESAEWAELCTPARPRTETWKTWTKRAVEKAESVSWERKSESDLPPDQKLLWDYSGLFCNIPKWDHTGEFRKAINENPLPPKRPRPTPLPTPELMPQQVRQPADESAGSNEPDKLELQHMAQTNGNGQTKPGAEAPKITERDEQDTGIGGHYLNVPKGTT